MEFQQIIFIIFLFFIGIGIGVYGTHITEMQMRFDNECKLQCNYKNMSFETTFWSSWNDVNGKCYCKNIIKHT